ncbi:MAG TPA: sigma-70 family RNA polymerase sigma factor, partial [Puia sp.]|nr:sigma-70 family RNA polymerase sigma factor [Puia sp.]
DLFPSEDEDMMIGLRDILLDESNNPETERLRNLFWETLNDALEELPEEQKQAFVLNELQDIPFKEIAEQTGTTVNTLISRKRYAVLHLRNRMRDLRDELLNY